MARPETNYVLAGTCEGTAALVGGPAGLKEVILPGLASAALRREVLRRHPGAVADDRGLRGAARALARYFETGRISPGRLRFDLEGVGSLRRAVYDELGRVPAGETVTYAELARRIGRPGAHRAVGTAVSRNPLPVFVPCHRVVRSDGGLGGYTPEGGIALKRRMLEREGAIGRSPGGA